ncbi:MAG: hypothetical protein E6230_02705 [Paenibacillus dendritiformis]|uniref:hypothetical protein n=1 Tax=uncultured Paenibacillus sp. TaxID=227322 RepID=UPI0025E365ED|nr:hypothetical protein [uncultured Paenibacillus sp.]MDU5141084.1 hypothetical protein [Paenibacillus dendritiformis]
MSEQPFRFDHQAFADRLARYSEADLRTIDAYFAVIALTRKTRKLSNGIIRGELEYWAKYPVDTVMYAIRQHIKSYVGKREEYTRGIIRNRATTGRVMEGGHHAIVGQSAEISQRGHYGQGDDRNRYIGEDDPLPI